MEAFALSTKSSFVQENMEVPDDWDEMSEDEQKEYIIEQLNDE